MKKAKKLSRLEASEFKRRLSTLPPMERKRVEENIRHRDDGGIDIIDALVIGAVASSLIDDIGGSDFGGSSSDFGSSDVGGFDGGGGDFGGGGASGDF